MTDKKLHLRQQMIANFKQAAVAHNQKVQPPFTLNDLLDKNDKSRVLLVLKESLGDHILLKSLLPEVRKKYPESSIYIGGDMKYSEVYEMDENLKKYIPYSPEMEQELLMTGVGNHKGFFSHYVNVATSTQKQLNYLTNKYE